MIPETHERREVRLYRALSFPTSWTFERTLLAGSAFVNSCLVRHRELWWLLTSLPGHSTLLAFYADTLSGPWRPHAGNPVVHGTRPVARAAGRPVTFAGQLIRFSQDNTPGYGRRVMAREIVRLTPTEYVERPVGADPLLAGSGRGWNAGGMHHVDAHPDDQGRWIACVDGFRKEWMFGYRRWPAGPTET